MIFKVKENQTKTDEELNVGLYLANVNFTPFVSNIKSLTLCFDDGKGNTGKYPIYDTLISSSPKKVTGDVWFEYSSTDKEYEIDLFIE
jgi:hypothetical protein